MAGATEIYQKGDKVIKAAAKFDATRAEENAAGARLQRAGNLDGHATGVEINCSSAVSFPYM